MRDKEWWDYQFSTQDLDFFKKKIINLNREKNADQAIFILKLTH